MDSRLLSTPGSASATLSNPRLWLETMQKPNNSSGLNALFLPSSSGNFKRSVPLSSTTEYDPYRLNRIQQLQQQQQQQQQQHQQILPMTSNHELQPNKYTKLNNGNYFPSINQSIIPSLVHATTPIRIKVFLNEVADQNLKMVDVWKTETISTFSSRLAVIFGIPARQQTIIALNTVHTFNMATFDPRIASVTPLNPQSTYLLIKNPSVAQAQQKALWLPKKPKPSTPVRVIRKPQPSEDFQKQVRDRLTKSLQTKSKRINLHIISEHSKYSKASLSLWRRNMYQGNTLAIAKAVDETLDTLGCEKIQAPQSAATAPSNTSETSKEINPENSNPSTTTTIQAENSEEAQKKEIDDDAEETDDDEDVNINQNINEEEEEQKHEEEGDEDEEEEHEQEQEEEECSEDQTSPTPDGYIRSDNPQQNATP